MSSIKVGVFDSGIGGLSIARAIKGHNPNYQIHYFSDSAYHPYGGIPEEQLAERSAKITQFLLDKGCQVIVVACNTATVNIISKLRSDFSAQFVGVEPGVKPAALVSGKNIAIWATENTLKSAQYKNLKKAHGEEHEIFDIACIGLADEIEKVSDSEAFGIETLNHFVEQTKVKECDTLVLGCTHYGLVKKDIEAKFEGQQLNIIDTADAVARQVVRVAGPASGSGNDDVFYTSGCDNRFKQQFRYWWPENSGQVLTENV